MSKTTYRAHFENVPVIGKVCIRFRADKINDKEGSAESQCYKKASELKNSLGSGTQLFKIEVKQGKSWELIFVNIMAVVLDRLPDAEVADIIFHLQFSELGTDGAISLLANSCNPAKARRVAACLIGQD